MLAVDDAAAEIGGRVRRVDRQRLVVVGERQVEPRGLPDEPLPVMEFVRAMFGFREGMTYLSPAPLYHSAPQASVAAALRLGCTTIVMEHFDPEQWLALVERYRVTHCQMVPVMFSLLLRLPGEVRARYDTSSLECIVHAAAPCPVPVKQAMIDWLGPIITEYYGATEANGFDVLHHRRMARISRHCRPSHPRRTVHHGRRGRGVPGRD